MESPFMPRDEVYHYHYGWGKIMHKSKDFIRVLFKHGEEPFNAKANMLSFTEYTLQGFSQERPIELPEVGELCLFYDNGWEKDDYTCGVFEGYYKGHEYPYKTTRGCIYHHVKRIKILD